MDNREVAKSLDQQIAKSVLEDTYQLLTTQKDNGPGGFGSKEGVASSQQLSQNSNNNLFAIGASECQRSSMNTSKMESVLNKELKEGEEDPGGLTQEASPDQTPGGRRQTLKSSSVLTDKEAEMIRIIQVLKKHPLKRTEEDVEMVIPYMKEVKFFKDRDIKALDYPDIVNALSYEHFKDGQCIMQWGELGDKFYILLKGQVGVLVPSARIKDSRDQMNDVVHDLEELELDLKEVCRLILVHKVRQIDIPLNSKEVVSNPEAQSPDVADQQAKFLRFGSIKGGKLFGIGMENMAKHKSTIEQQETNPAVVQKKKIDIMAEFIECSIKNAQRKQEAAATDPRQQSRKTTISNNVQSRKTSLGNEKSDQGKRQRMSKRLMDIDFKGDIVATLLEKKAEFENEIAELIAKRDEKLLDQVSTMATGTGFGELALLKDRLMSRAATIKCMGSCHLAVMSKSSYTKVLAKIDARQSKKLIDFFKSIPFLAKHSTMQLNKLNYVFEQKSFIRNQIIYNEGDPCNYVYLVQDGEFEVTKKIKVSGTMKPQYEKSDLAQFLSHSMKDQPSNPQSSYSDQTVAPKCIMSSKKPTNRLQIETFRVTLIGSGQIFGEEDVTQERPSHSRKYTVSVKCISNKANVFMMKADDFLKKFKANKESWRIINLVVEEKMKKQQERYLNIVGQMKKMQSTGKAIQQRESRNQANLGAIPKLDGEIYINKTFNEGTSFSPNGATKKTINSSQIFRKTLKGTNFTLNNSSNPQLLNRKELDVRITMQEIIQGYPYVSHHKSLLEEEQQQMDADDIQGQVIQGISIDYQSPGRNGGVTLLKKSASSKNMPNQIMVVAGKDVKEYLDTGAKPASASTFNKTAQASKSQNAFTKVKSLQKQGQPTRKGGLSPLLQNQESTHKSPESQMRSGERYYISSKITSKLEDLKKTTLASNDEYSQAEATLNTQGSVDRRAEGFQSRSQKRSGQRSSIEAISNGADQNLSFFADKKVRPMTGVQISNFHKSRRAMPQDEMNYVGLQQPNSQLFRNSLHHKTNFKSCLSPKTAHRQQPKQQASPKKNIHNIHQQSCKSTPNQRSQKYVKQYFLNHLVMANKTNQNAANYMQNIQDNMSDIKIQTQKQKKSYIGVACTFGSNIYASYKNVVQCPLEPVQQRNSAGFEMNRPYTSASGAQGISDSSKPSTLIRKHSSVARAPFGHSKSSIHVNRVRQIKPMLLKKPTRDQEMTRDEFIKNSVNNRNYNQTEQNAQCQRFIQS